MPGFGDTTFILLLALLLFGPKKLPGLARQLGKLMAEFRRASNEFRTQMEEELRIAELSERQKQIEAIQASAPEPIPEPEHPHLPSPPQPPAPATDSAASSPPSSIPDSPPEADYIPLVNTAPQEFSQPEPLAIATSGGINLMPPSTGLPVATARPRPAAEPDTAPPAAHPENAPEPEAHPWRI